MAIGVVVLITFCCIGGLFIGVYAGVWLSRVLTSDDRGH